MIHFVRQSPRTVRVRIIHVDLSSELVTSSIPTSGRMVLGLLDGLLLDWLVQSVLEQDDVVGFPGAPHG